MVSAAPTALPTSRATRINPQPFRVWLCRRLFLPFPLSSTIEQRVQGVVCWVAEVSLWSGRLLKCGRRQADVWDWDILAWILDLSTHRMDVAYRVMVNVAGHSWHHCGVAGEGNHVPRTPRSRSWRSLVPETIDFLNAMVKTRRLWNTILGCSLAGRFRCPCWDDGQFLGREATSLQHEVVRDARFG